MIIITILIVGIMLVIGIIPLGILILKSTFKGTAIIIRESSSGYDIIIDRFKKKRIGDSKDIVVLEFWKYVKEKTPSPKFKFWHKINKRAAFTQEFDQRKLKKSWGDAIIFVQTADHELVPCVVEKGVIKTLDNDNRQFLARHIVSVNEFVKREQGKLAQVLLVIAPIFFAILGAIIMWVIFQTQMTENIASICQQASSNAGLLTNLQGMVGA